MNILITLLGGEALPLYYPIKQFKPDVVYIISTSRTEEIAERLKSLLSTKQEGELGELIPVIKTVKYIETDALR